MVVWSDAFRHDAARAEHPPIEVKPETTFKDEYGGLKYIC